MSRKRFPDKSRPDYKYHKLITFLSVFFKYIRQVNYIPTSLEFQYFFVIRIHKQLCFYVCVMVNHSAHIRTRLKRPVNGVFRLSVA